MTKKEYLKLSEFTYDKTLKLVEMETPEFLADYIYKITKTYNLLIDKANNRYKAIKNQEKYISKLHLEAQRYFDMMMDNHYNSIEIDCDLKNIIISALRYSLGRKTYITFETADFIMKHPELIDERVCIVMLRDLGRYFEDRELWETKDDECDYESWVTLQNWLFKIAKERNFNIISYERR